MQNRIPAAFSPAFFGNSRFVRAVALSLLLGGVAQVAQASSVGETPQTRSFTAASRVARDLAKQQPGSRLMIVESTYSMYPMLDWDSIVVVAPVSINHVQVGDVVCFRDQHFNGRRVISHRVEKILQKDNRLVTRGDNLDRADRHPVGADALIGKVVYVVYFDRTGEQRPVDHTLPTPSRHEQVRRL